MAFNATKFKKLNLSNYILHEDLNKHTTFKIGGKCLAFVQVGKIKELKKVLKFCIKNKVKYFILGAGSNVLFSDGGFNGVVIRFSDCYSDVKLLNKKNGVDVLVMSGMKLNKLNIFCAKNGLSGLEWSFGIPASVGGAIYSNAGSFEKCMADVVKNVKVLYVSKILFFKVLKVKRISQKQCNFSYRNSIFKCKNYIILSALLHFENSQPELVNEKMKNYVSIKKQTQPLGTKNAGCIFKNGHTYKIAKLINDLNLKGKTIGDAQISTKHCGFIVNKSKATCQNVKDLINYIQIKVQKAYGINPELEIELIEEGENT